jgi:hypothetical protein
LVGAAGFEPATTRTPSVKGAHFVNIGLIWLGNLNLNSHMQFLAFTPVWTTATE